MRRRCAGTCSRAAVSSSVSPSIAMTPRSGRSSPAIMLISEVLPAPEAPNSPVTRACAGRTRLRARIRRAVLRRRRAASSVPVQALGGAPREPFRGDQRRHRDDDRHHDQPQRRGVAVGRLDQRIDRRRKWSGFRRECSRRR